MNIRQTMRLMSTQLVVVYLLLIAPISCGQQYTPSVTTRQLSVTDCIQLKTLGDPIAVRGPSRGRVAQFSPDRKHFFVLLKKGDLSSNTNQYSLLLYDSAAALNAPKGQVIVTMASSSNQPAIADPKWLADNETIVFLGEMPGRKPQLYKVSVRTKKHEQVTNLSKAVTGYDLSVNGRLIVFEAGPYPNWIAHEREASRESMVIDSTRHIEDILAPEFYAELHTLWNTDELFMITGGRSAFRVPLPDVVFGETAHTSISPDGHYALIETYVRQVPETWVDYDEEPLHRFVTEARSRRGWSLIRQYMLLDIERRRIEPLIQAPMSLRNDAAVWAPDSQAVVVSGAHLPLDTADPSERAERRKKAYVVEVNIQTREVVKITDEGLKISRWERPNERILLEPQRPTKNVPAAAYQREGAAWNKVPVSPTDDRASDPLEVTIDEEMNTPPKIYVSDPATHKKELLLDLNPELAERELGTVEAVSWNATDGHEVLGGLFLPGHLVPGERYPLVIQTHGFAQDKFRLDGPFSSAFAARPLVGKGFIVLQVGGSKDAAEDTKSVNTMQEAPRDMAAYEGAIDYLDRRGIVDPNHVGIIGFSRTVYEVAYTLTHSKYHFAAATLADGFNGGYFPYLLSIRPTSDDYSLVNGGPPIGDNLHLWLKNSPSFNLDKVRCPVRLESYGQSGGLLSGWDWYVGLSDLGKPVDFIYLPGAPHLLVKPRERMISQQGNVDWFAFWLKGEEDADPAKAEQYKRWRELRKPQQDNEKKTAGDSALH